MPRDIFLESGVREMVPTIPEVVKQLRLRLGDTQQRFANRLNLAISTVVRYESTRPPKGKALSQLYQLAVDSDLWDVAFMFRRAVEADLGPDADAEIALLNIEVAQLLFDLTTGKEAPERKLDRALTWLELLHVRLGRFAPRVPKS